MTDRVLLPIAIFDGMEAVRRSGITHMLDRKLAAKVADAMGRGDAADWIRANQVLYFEALFRGIKASE